MRLVLVANEGGNVRSTNKGIIERNFKASRCPTVAWEQSAAI